MNNDLDTLLVTEYGMIKPVCPVANCVKCDI